MKEDTELEEGEAFYYKDDDEDNIDPDSFSYIDEKIQHVLGHFQKEFEGGVSAENLGAKFGGYGSFLPTQERSPRLLSHPRTPQRNHSSPKFNNNPHMEAVSHNRKAPTNVPHPSRIENASHSSHLFRDLREASANDSVKKEEGISSCDQAERCTLKDDTTKNTENSTDQRTLKLRIKMKSNILAQKNAEIYSGLGLDDSPSSSMDNSPVESEGMPPVSQESDADSPTGMIQVMSYFPIPGGVLISPLHESVLNLIKNDNKANGDSRFSYPLNGHQDSLNEPDSFVRAGHLKKNTVRMARQSEKQLELKHPNGTLSEKETTLHKKKKIGNRTPDCKDFLPNELKWTPLSSSICDAGEFAEVTAKASKASKEVNENGVLGRMASEEALKEESLESISGQDFGKTVKQNVGNGFLKKAPEHNLESSHKDNSTDPMNNNSSNTSIISNKVEREVLKCKADHKSETRQKIKAVSERKNKSKGNQSPGKAKAIARKKSFGGTNNAMVIEKGSTGFDSTCINKMKSRSLLDKNFSDGNRDSMKEKRSERKVDSLAGNGEIKNAKISNGKQSAFGIKAKERMSGHKVVKQVLAGPCINDTSASCPIAENNVAPEMISSAVAVPQLIEEDWVCCDSCQKWRLLPTGMKPEHLPEKWLCSMLNWLPGMNSCEFSEDETTKALYALYQMPISQVQNNMQSHGTETAIGVSSPNSLQYGLNQNMSSSDMSDRGRKKLVIKEKTMSGINNDMHRFSNSVKANVQVSGKNRSLNGLNQHPADLNPVKKMTNSSKHLSRPDNMIEEKHVPKENEKQVNGGDRKHVKLKRKVDAEQYKSGPPKKLKTENVFSANIQSNSDMNLEKVSLYSRNGLPTKASGKDMRKYDEYCLSEDASDRLPVTVKKEGDQAQVSSGLMKKRKLKDRLDDEKQYGEEGDATEFGKEKKYRILKSVNEGDNKLSKGGIREVCRAGNGDHMAVGTEVRLGDKRNQLRKHRKNVASLHASDGIDQVRKDLDSRPHSLAATSSSSKVSGSHKAKTKLEDVRSSPVESVTSSPLRAFNLDKNNFAVVDTSVKDNVTKGGQSAVGSKRSVDNRDRKLSVKLKEGRIPHDLHTTSHKLSSTENQVEDAKDKCRLQTKNPSELKNNHLLEGGVHVEQSGYCANGVHKEEKVKKENLESELSWQKSGKVTSLNSKEKGKKISSHVCTDNIKTSVSETVHSKKGGRYDSAADPSNHASDAETKNVVKYTLPKSKSEIEITSQKSALIQGPNETGKQTEIKPRDFEKSAPEIDVQRGNERKAITRQDSTHDFEEENKANHVITESRVGKSKVLSSAAGELKREALNMGSRTVPQYQKGGMANEHPVNVSDNGDLVKSMRNFADISNNAGVNCSSGNSLPDQQPSFSSPLRTNFNQTTVDTLEEATKLKDRADNYKNSGFDFESNETYFQAGLKFLHGASILENCHNDSSKLGEMSQMQIYATAAKLFKCCALEYEARQEMAAAALAYKCMEVAYMRVVYCKNSSTNRDRHELQSTLHLASQGESPSSSASDVDNLNNQAAADRATLPRGTNSHVAINHVISARTRPSLIRLLDFTKDIHLSMEASRKCQSTFAAASVILEESRNKDCIASIRSVVDFSFQDVDELVRLVWTASKAISRAGLGGARD
ncbi:uncharacterized protein LOC106762170 isoform X1 [Vigna radiata var. radiata]|uniref:Uncharacterized protein LOC106762170 isoform X1 n=2 Tax=Vigna radiata var. radiata TaxID=3916 RepID=A0A1S3U5U2_VIGRR|nr:uncharacterized protein LOC106762170 isoform X1 [Vigna radiata var. radiata]XP_014501409.1 uncharacterized protein LOC106762170 isoform X1 [Vigna radiata var. radiata]